MEQEPLLTTKDVSALTGWSTRHIQELCKRKVLPHIPGKATRFVRRSLLEALDAMQTGGQYGRRTPKHLTKGAGK